MTTVTNARDAHARARADYDNACDATRDAFDVYNDARNAYNAVFNAYNADPTVLAKSTERPG